MANQNMDGGVINNLENGSSAAHEVSSTTPIIEITKRSLRVQCWKKIQDEKVGVAFNSIFNRIPRFIDGDKAAENFAATEEFKKAQHIKINIDRALHAAKLQVLLTGKNLYLPATRDSHALYLKVDVPSDANDEQKKELLYAQDVHKHRIEIGLDNKIPLDLVLIGSVVVSRDGYRIGRGNGFTDLDIGLLIEVGAITPNTIIATMVHDVQVVDSLPIHLFQKYDTPVDLIITPTEVIRVANRLPRPTGIFWELLSERRLKLVPVLNKLHEQLTQNGKQITLKEYDTDVEQYHNNNRSRRRGPMRRRYSRRNPQRRTQSQTDTEQQAAQESNNTQTRRYARRPRRFGNRRRRTTKSEGDQSAVEGGKSQERERKPTRNQTNNAGGGGGGNMRKQKPRKQRMPQRDFCIKLSNISRDVRVKDLKTELRRRECAPLFISWKGQFGKCYLHFGNRNGTPSTDDDIDKVLKSLSDLSLTVNVGGNSNNANASTNENEAADAAGTEQNTQNLPRTKTVNVNVELIKYDKEGDAAASGSGAAVTNGADVAAGGDAADGGRIESVDTTTCWKKIQDEKVGVAFNSILNRIPRFIAGDKAAENFAATEEFKKAQHIKINIDRALHAAKLQVLLTGKNLYLPATRDSHALYLKVDVPSDVNDEQKKELLNEQDVQKHRIEIGLDNTIPLDLVLIGSVVVSRDGYRIGRGNGFTGLDIGLLIEVGAITPNTIIATMVHDVQVVDSLPIHLFQKYDTPVDLIITPTEVIRVANRLPRPTGIFWELLSERRLKLVPVLNKLHEQLTQNGKQITLKEYDTDVEQYHKNKRSRRRYSRRNPQRRTRSQTDTEQQTAQESNNTQTRRYARRHRRRRTTKSEGD